VKGVGLVERVSVIALGFCGILRGEGRSSQEIDSTGHSFEVGRPDAPTVSAEMVEFQSVGNGADQQLVGNLMGNAVVPALLDPERAVPVVELPADPVPAVSADFNLGPKAVLVSSFHSHLQGVTGSITRWL
jgi:hypothetical protein